MKALTALPVILLFAFPVVCQAQTDRENPETDTVKQKNLLDEQTKMYGQIFTLAGASDAENPTGGANNYLDMIENMEGSEELKEQVRELYHLYDASLDPTRKEELQLMVSKMLQDAMEEGQEEN